MTNRETILARVGRRTLGLMSLVALVAASGSLPSALAAPVTAVGGYDHYVGPLGQTTDGVVGAAVMGVGRGDVTLAAVGFDDTYLGRGSSLTGGIGAPMGAVGTMRLAGTRYFGAQSFRAWRAKVGPQLSLPGGSSLTLSYTHYREDGGAHSNGALAEAATPLGAGFTGKASTSYATAAQGPAALQGSLGLGWNAATHVELSCEVGLARNAAGASGQPFPSRGLLDGLPILGGGSPGQGNVQNAEQVDGTLLVGIRVTVP